jgi:hypothetical protein
MGHMSFVIAIETTLHDGVRRTVSIPRCNIVHHVRSSLEREINTERFLNVERAAFHMFAR